MNFSLKATIIICIALVNIVIAAAVPCGSMWLIEESYELKDPVMKVMAAPKACEIGAPDDYEKLKSAQEAAYKEFRFQSKTPTLEEFAAALWEYGWKNEPMVLAEYDKQIPLTGGDPIEAGQTIYTATKNHFGKWESNNINLPGSGYKPIEYNAYYDPNTGEIKNTCKIVVNSVKIFNATS